MEIEFLYLLTMRMKTQLSGHTDSQQTTHLQLTEEELQWTTYFHMKMGR